MLFAIDIDLTIAGGFKPYANYYNEELGLGIPLHILDTITGYPDLYRQPEMIAYRRTHERHFLAVFARVRESIPAMLALEPLSGAIDGVRLLSELGTVRYYTIRKSQDVSINEQIQEATKRWLAEKNFPNPSNIAFCLSFTNKLVKIRKEPDDRLVFIDDKCTSLLKAFEESVWNTERPRFAEDICQRLTLVDFGIKTAPLPAQQAGIKILALPSWNHISEMIASLGF